MKKVHLNNMYAAFRRKKCGLLQAKDMHTATWLSRALPLPPVSAAIRFKIGSKMSRLCNTIVFIVHLFNIAAITCSGQELYPFWKDYKWGFVDESGQVIIEPTYDAVNYFCKGHASVLLDNKWGYINSQGKLVVKPQFDRVFEVIYGAPDVLSIFNIGEIKGRYLVKVGNIYKQLPFQRTINSFREGRTIVQDENNSYLIDMKGNIYFKANKMFTSLDLYDNGYVQVVQDKKYGLIDRNGDWIIELQDTCLHRRISDGMIMWSHNDKYGFVNIKGQFLPNVYELASDFINGHAAVSLNNHAWNVIDIQGREILPQSMREIIIRTPNTIWCSPFLVGDNSGSKMKETIHIYDHHGKMLNKVLPNIKIEDRFSVNGVAVYHNNNHKFGLVTEFGSIVTDTTFNSISARYPYFIVRLDDKQGVIDSEANYFIKPEYDRIEYTKDRYWIVRRNNKEGLFDPAGRMIFPPVFDRINDRVGLNAFQIIKNNKIGYIDKSGTFFINPDTVTYFSAPVDFEYWIASYENRSGMIIPSCVIHDIAPMAQEHIPLLLENLGDDYMTTGLADRIVTAMAKKEFIEPILESFLVGNRINVTRLLNSILTRNKQFCRDISSEEFDPDRHEIYQRLLFEDLGITEEVKIKVDKYPVKYLFNDTNVTQDYPLKIPGQTLKILSSNPYKYLSELEKSFQSFRYYSFDQAMIYDLQNPVIIKNKSVLPKWLQGAEPGGKVNTIAFITFHTDSGHMRIEDQFWLKIDDQWSYTTLSVLQE